MTKDTLNFFYATTDAFATGIVVAHGRYRLLKPIEEEFSEGFKPSAAFLERWQAEAPKRRLALRLAKMRIEAGKSQAEIAEATGIDPTYVSKMESPVGPVPKADKVALFADACGFDTAYAFIRRDTDKHGATALLLHGVMPEADGVVVLEAADTTSEDDSSPGWESGGGFIVPPVATNDGTEQERG